VLAGSQGQQIFEITRQVNSQLTGQPVWLPDGSTGNIVQVLDVAALAQDQDTVLTLKAFSTNIGDSILPTSVHAGLDTGALLKINAVTPVADSWQALNDKTYYSIPATGQTNHFKRRFKLALSRSDDVTINKVKVELTGAGQETLVFEEAPGANAEAVAADTLRVLASFAPNPATLGSAPPPTDTIRFRFTITGSDGAGNTLSDTLTDVPKHPLWHAPATMARFSRPADPGDDDWCAKATYEWIGAHPDVLRAVNDISGEHGKNLGHQGHAKGTDIDMYHFYLFPGANASSGTANYQHLLAAVRDLPKLDSSDPAQRALGSAARERINAWIGASRNGIDAAAVLPTVSQVGYIRGGPDSAGLAANWGQRLLQAGIVRVGGKDYDLGAGSWNNPKYYPWPDHHHHVHLTLDLSE
jgi:hypothetical protein